MKNQKEFEKGDIVTLKSGGPEMTVEAFKFEISTGMHNQKEIQCTWFKGEDRFTEYFNAMALVKVKQNINQKSTKMNRAELLSVVKEMSFHDLLNLYVDAKAGGHNDFLAEMAPMDRPLVNQLEEKLNEIIEYIKNL